MKETCFKVLIVFVLFFLQVANPKVLAAVDVTKPVFESISVDKTEVKVGDTVNITVKASDSESGLRNHLDVNYKSIVTGRSQRVTLYYNNSSSSYEGSIIMMDSMPSGEWNVDYFFIYDNEGNSTYKSGPIPGSSFTLSGTNVDIVKPTFNSINVDKSEVTVGEKVNITVKASDSESGLRNHLDVNYKSIVTGRSQRVTLYYNDSSSSYEGSIIMTDSMPSGEWNVDYFFIYDNQGNSTYKSGPIPGSSFTLSGTNVDIVKPTFNSINVDKAAVKVGEKVNIIVKASDSESGLRNYLDVNYKSIVTGRSQRVTLYYNDSSSSYEGSIIMADSMPYGEWNVDYFFIYDNEGNSTYKSGPIPGSSFTLEDYTKDHTNPTFEGMNVNKSTVDTGDYVGITVNASDDTLVKSVAVNYIKPITNEIETVHLIETDKGKFTKDFYLHNDSEYGEWKISSVEIIDLNGNKTVEKDLSNGNFTVLQPIEPLSYRMVTNNETWSNQVINGDVYIGPSAILTVNGNVKINGNVYVLGALKSYGGLYLNGTLKAKRVYWGSRYTLYNGEVAISGSNSISSMNVSANPLESVPFEIYNTPIIEENGKISIQGATVPVVDVYVNNEKLDLKSNGTFRLNGYEIGDTKEITVTFMNIFGYTTTKKYKVYNNQLPVVSNHKPDGIYLGDQFIDLSLSKEGTIFYTLDGSEPTKNSSVFQEPIKINKSVTLKYFAEDEIGNKSTTYTKQYSLFFMDEVTNESNRVKGSGEPGLTVSIEVKGQTYSTLIDSDGRFELDIPNLKDEAAVAVSASGQDGHVSSSYQVQVKDVIPPTIQGVEQDGMYSTDRAITFNEGTALLNGNPFTSGEIVKAEGVHTLEVTDSTGNKTTVEFTIDKTAPMAEGVMNNGIYNKDVAVTFNEGTATLNGELFTSGTVVKEEGTYLLEIIDAIGNKTTVKFALDKIAPEVSGIVNNAFYNKDVTVHFSEGIATLNGHPFTNGTVVKTAGTYTLVVTDEAANKTTLTFTLDKTAPAIPAKITVSDQMTVVSGKAETFAVVKLYIAGKYQKSVVADKYGNYRFTIKKQKAGIEIKVTATDKAGNVSGARIVKVIDKTAPVVPTINAVSDKSTVVSGKTEASAVVKLYIAGKYQKSVVADKYGNYKFTIKKQRAGIEMKVTATDKSGNVSSARKVKVSDKTAPAIPTVNKINSKSTSVTGKAEKGAVVYVYKGKTYIGKVVVDSKGNFKVKIKAQKKGTILTVYAKDKAGNQSGKRTIKVY